MIEQFISNDNVVAKSQVMENVKVHTDLNYKIELTATAIQQKDDKNSQIKQNDIHNKAQDVSNSEEICLNINEIEQMLTSMDNHESVSEESFIMEQKYDTSHSNQANYTDNNHIQINIDNNEFTSTISDGEKSPPAIPLNTLQSKTETITNKRYMWFKTCFPGLVIVVGFIVLLMLNEIQSELLAISAVIVIMFALILIPTISVYFSVNYKYVYRSAVHVYTYWFITYVYDLILAVPTILLICLMVWIIPGTNAFREDAFFPTLITVMLFVLSVLPFVYCIGCIGCSSRKCIKSVFCAIMLLVGLIPLLFEFFGNNKLDEKLKYVLKILMGSYCAADTLLQYEIKAVSDDTLFDNYYSWNPSKTNWLIMTCQLFVYFGLLNVIQYFKIIHANAVNSSSEPAQDIKQMSVLNWKSFMQESISGDADIVIGSRRKKNSHVIGKPLMRQIQSKGFNLLVRLLLNVQVTDTQVGSKLFKAKVIKTIHKDFKERSMSFDVEILKLALKNNYKINEQAIIWIDSQIESKSAQQANNMLHGLLNIWKSIYYDDGGNHVKINVNSKQDFIDKGLMLKKMELRLLESVLDLAINDKFNFIVSHLLDAYKTITPKQFRIFMDSLQQFMYDILTTNKDIHILKKEICELLVLFKRFIDTFQQTDIINFMCIEFPQT
eukprot:66547_1